MGARQKLGLSSQPSFIISVPSTAYFAYVPSLLGFPAESDLVTVADLKLGLEYGYTYTWAEFKALTDPQEAASAFLYQYERPAVYTSEPVRRGYAQEWYDEMLTGWPSDPGSDVARNIWDILGGIIWDQRRRKVRP